MGVDHLSVLALVPLLTSASHMAPHNVERAFGDTWCSTATCDLRQPAHILWSHGNGQAEATCIGWEPPYVLTDVDTVSVTVWAPDSHNVLYTTADGQIEQDMEIVVERSVGGIRTEVKTVPIEVHHERETYTISHSVAEPLWVRLKTRVTPGQADPVVDHVVYYEFLMWDSAGTLPPAGAACATDPATCEAIGYEKSTACEVPVPCVERDAGVHNCECECSGSNYSFPASSMGACNSLRCSSFFPQCDSTAKTQYDSAIEYCGVCGADDDCTCDCCRSGNCKPLVSMRVEHKTFCTVGECAKHFYDCPDATELAAGTVGSSSIPVFSEHAACEPPSPPPAAAPCDLDDCTCECCFGGSPDENDGFTQCPDMKVRSFRAGSEDRCTVDHCMTRFSNCPDRGAHNLGSKVVPLYTRQDSCPAPPPPLTPPDGDDEVSTPVMLAVGLAMGGMAMCLAVMAAFIFWIRHR